jgi:hypothetical protein
LDRRNGRAGDTTFDDAGIDRCDQREGLLNVGSGLGQSFVGGVIENRHGI